MLLCNGVQIALHTIIEDFSMKLYALMVASHSMRKVA
jgi:hypothetical protein